MKRVSRLLCVIVPLLYGVSTFAQLNTGSIAFIAFNGDGDRDFAIVTMVDLPANTVIHFTDKALDGTGDFTSGEGVLSWDTGAGVISKGTVVIFNDIDTSLSASIGTLTEPDTGFHIAIVGDTLFAFIGTNYFTPTTIIAGLQIGNNSANTGNLNNSGLIAGKTLIVLDDNASPDGGYYNGSRTDQTSFNGYLTNLANESNWITGDDGETLIAAASTTSFSLTASSAVSWTGISSSDYGSSANWAGDTDVGGIPGGTSALTIPSGTPNSPVLTSAIALRNLTINEGATFTINKGGKLFLFGDLINNGTLIINSDDSDSGAIQASGFLYGNITYNRHVKGNEWHLVAAPVREEGYDDAWVTSNSIASGNGDNRGISTYNNNGGTWSYMQSGGSGNFDSGKGYGILSTADGTLGFTGKMPKDISIPLTQGTTNKWNLVGNPYPSFMYTNGNGGTNLINTNSASLSPSFQAIYLWDNSQNSGAGGYIAINNASSDHFLSPGQGFFVNTVSGGASFNLSETLLSLETDGNFLRSSDQTSTIELRITDGSLTRSTYLKYLDEATTSLDPGYDAGQFHVSGDELSVFSHLVSDDNNIRFQLQALPSDSFETTVVPIGIVADSGLELTFTASLQSLPEEINVFIEDREEQTYKKLNEDGASYVVELAESLDGIGRFYLHTTTQETLDIDSYQEEKVAIYMKDNRTLRIDGVRDANSTLRIFNLLGQEVVMKKLEDSGSHEIVLSKGIRTSIYIVEILNTKKRITKKIIIE
jgi:hypothetical protein